MQWGRAEEGGKWRRVGGGSGLRAGKVRRTNCLRLGREKVMSALRAHVLLVQPCVDALFFHVSARETENTGGIIQNRGQRGGVQGPETSALLLSEMLQGADDRNEELEYL